MTMAEFGAAFSDLIEEQAEWSQKTFGTDDVRGPIGPLKHLEKEAKEAQQKPDDIMEYADCLLLLLDATRRAKIKSGDLLLAAHAKLRMNRTRKWPKIDDWKMGEPHFVDSEDCMGRKFRCWRVFADREGETILGFGETKEQAIQECRNKMNLLPVMHIRESENTEAGE